MEYRYPPEFPQKSRDLVSAEGLRAAREFDSAKRRVRLRSEVEALLRNYILQVFISFVREASDLVRQGLWSVDRLQSEAREFLRQCTIQARYEKGYDGSGHRLPEMVSNWGGGILPEIHPKYSAHLSTLPNGRSTKISCSKLWRRRPIGSRTKAQRKLPAPSTRVENQTLNWRSCGVKFGKCTRPASSS
jgi:hypothetical protein